jgi:hypothetical protein
VIAIFPIRASRARRSPCVNGESLFTAFRTLRYSADALQNHRRDAIDVAVACVEKQAPEAARARCMFVPANPRFKCTRFRLSPDTLYLNRVRCSSDLSMVVDE